MPLMLHLMQMVAHVNTTLDLSHSVKYPYKGGISVHVTGLFKYASGGRHDMHVDTDIPSRCLSCSIVLTDPAQFSGGVFHLHAKDPPFEIVSSINPQRGRLVCFLSENMHSVSEITSGTRHAAFFWVSCDKGQDGVMDPPLSWDGTRDGLAGWTGVQKFQRNTA